MFFKKFKKTCSLLLLSIFIMPLNVLAYSDYIIAGGDNVGIQLNSKGVMVVGLYKVNNTFPGKEANLQVGDVITKVNDKMTSNINDLVSEFNNVRNLSVNIEYLRNSVSKKTTLKLSRDENNVIKTGLYVKDGITGIGTLTFIDPNTKKFGALGHEIIEKTTGKILDIKDGKIFESTVTGIEPSVDGTPGEKNARFFSEKVKGNIDENTDKGIFGTYSEKLPNKKLYKVAKPHEISTGNAKILTVTSGDTIEEYSINITKVNNNQNTKNITFEITDQKLLNKTGGIVQGMSGSPIIKDDYIIGAVTHVVIESPSKGYGIFITNMLEEAEK